jgi:dihydrofolate reductase
MSLFASEFITLDGITQAPGDPEEDQSGGFRHGGWSWEFSDPAMHDVINEFALRSKALLQGRRTYEVSAAAWPEREGAFADWINATEKYVVSDTLSSADVTWPPTTIVRGADHVRDIAALKEHIEGDIYIYGSLALVRSLLAAELIDELVLMIEPITLGGGKTLFPTDGVARKLELLSARTTATGVQICRYRPRRIATR